ncbi:hypothetical protein ACIRPK_27320 [Kitasatospora sp. NPDC101801]|uniref:hypothetical protein n=1 Tax=Kitasatospora sp. NPDC101801 TaxID=3364103 RepID=UPI00381D78FC
MFNPSVGCHEKATVGSSTANDVTRAVLLAPTASTHSVDTGQPPGCSMLFLLDEEGVPGAAAV